MLRRVVWHKQAYGLEYKKLRDDEIVEIDENGKVLLFASLEKLRTHGHWNEPVTGALRSVYAD